MSRDYTKKANERGARIRESYRIADTGMAENLSVSHEVFEAAQDEIARLSARVRELEEGRRKVKECVSAMDALLQEQPKMSDVLYPILENLVFAVGRENPAGADRDTEIERLRARVEELEAYNLGILEEACRYKTRGIILSKVVRCIIEEWDFATDGEPSVAIETARVILNTPVEPAYLPPTAAITPTGDTQGVPVHPAPNVTLAGGK